VGVGRVLVYDLALAGSYQPRQLARGRQIGLTPHSHLDNVEVLTSSVRCQRSTRRTRHSALMTALLQSAGEIQRLLLPSPPGAFRVDV